PWDAEGRLGGNAMLPLTTDGEIALRESLKSLPYPIDAVYTFLPNQACQQAAKLVAQHFNLRVRDADLLEPISMGLWQGLTRDELRFRFPTVFAQWEENPLSVNPPQGESLEAAADRFRQALRKILRRNRAPTIALVLRPLSLQVIAGLLRNEDLQTITTHLHDTHGMETIEIADTA
ncbi:MAG: Phosphoglycerate mutase family, partial [Phycisphaerales bacterium]|nr:Phosphoglycerate mutase family [Phycisphaerales bacterium]